MFGFEATVVPKAVLFSFLFSKLLQLWHTFQDSLSFCLKRKHFIIEYQWNLTMCLTRICCNSSWSCLPVYCGDLLLDSRTSPQFIWVGCWHSAEISMNRERPDIKASRKSLIEKLGAILLSDLWLQTVTKYSHVELIALETQKYWLCNVKMNQ